MRHVTVYTSRVVTCQGIRLYPSVRMCGKVRHVTREELERLPLNERIRYMVKAFGGNSQRQFAERLGTSRERVNRWARGKEAPGEEYATKIAALGGFPASLFMKPPALDMSAEVAQQLVQQSSLLGELVAAAEELRQLIAELREVALDPPGSNPAGSSRRRSQK